MTFTDRTGSGAGSPLPQAASKTAEAKARERVIRAAGRPGKLAGMMNLKVL
ncbi:hypothetical protein [Ramlibacter tataouinensis]|uniref:hypothetical protein n=1 Tax=Ramlibacter tataouinensis TaxID=94132 RepID=UPI001D12A792|nr:hypothetical protein [Ramlibacter tataouinensis]